MIEKTQKKSPWFGFTVWMGCATFAFSLASFAYSGLFSRYMADDYCKSVYTRIYGFWNGQAAAYRIETGRFMVNFLTSVSEYFGPFAYRLMPGLVIILWSAGMGWFFLRARRFLPFRVPAAAAWLLGMLVVLSSIVGAPSRLQSLYWRDGMFNYGFPMVFFSLLLVAGIVQLEKQRPLWIFLLAGSSIALISFLAGGEHETFAAFEIVFSLIAGVGFILLGRGWLRRRALLLVLCSLAGSLPALGLIWFSPVTHARQAYFPLPPDLVTLIKLSLRYAYIFMRTYTNLMKLVTIMTAGIPAAAMFYLSPKGLPGKWWQWLLAVVLIPLLGYALLVAICAPSAYGESSYPEGRTLMIARFALVCTMVFLGGAAGLALRRGLDEFKWSMPAFTWLNRAALALMALLCLYSMFISWQINSKEIPARQAWAAVWDQRDAQLRQAASHGATSITVVALDSWETIFELGADPNHWANKCAAQFYGLKQIIAYPP